MVVSPFTGAASGYSDLSSALNIAQVGSSLASVEGSGRTVSAINARIGKISSHLLELTNTSEDVSGKCHTQAGIDDELAHAPTSSDVSSAASHLSQVISASRNGTATPDELTAAKNHWQDVKNRHDAAKVKHATDTEGSSGAPTSLAAAVPDLSDDPGSPGGPGDGPGDGSGGGSPGGPGDDPDDSPDGKKDSAPGGGPQNPPQFPAQPQGAGGSAGGGQPPMPPMGATGTGMPPDTGKDPLDDLPLDDTNIGTSTSGDTSGGTGSAMSGIGHSVTARTSADVSGMNSPAVSAGPVRGSGAGGMMGGGMMGGMGGMGGGMGGKAPQRGKERPTIASSDRGQLGKDSLEDSIEGGVIGRSTSAKPE